MEVRSGNVGDRQECGEKWQCDRKAMGFSGQHESYLCSAYDPRVSNYARQADSIQQLTAVYKFQKDKQQCKNK